MAGLDNLNRADEIDANIDRAERNTDETNKPNMLKIQNPFEQEENLTVWLKQDAYYLSSETDSLGSFKNQIQQNHTLNLNQTKQQNTNNPIMSFQESYKNFVNTITKHSITATLIMLLALGTVSVAAAQLFAPEDYKPSNVIGITKKPETKINNVGPVEEVKPAPIVEKVVEAIKPVGSDVVKVEVKNVIKPLVADGENDVILVDSCDLQTKVKKNIPYGGVTTDGYTYEKQPGLFLRYKTPAFGPGFAVQIDCGTKPMTFDEFNKTVKRNTAPAENTKYFEENDPLGSIKIENVLKDVICKEVGLSEFLCNQVKNQVKITVPLADGAVTAYYFSTENRSYIVSYVGSSTKESPIKLEYFKGNPALAKLNTYTNQYFPDFKLVYDDSWKFETSTTSNNFYLNLLNRKIFITKNQSKIEITLDPLPIKIGCGGPGLDEQEISKVGTSLLKYNGPSNNTYVYGLKGSVACSLQNRLNTNIGISTIKLQDGLKSTFDQVYGDLKNATYTYRIVLESSSPQEILEAEAILAQSTFK